MGIQSTQSKSDTLIHIASQGRDENSNNNPESRYIVNIRCSASGVPFASSYALNFTPQWNTAFTEAHV